MFAVTKNYSRKMNGFNRIKVYSSVRIQQPCCNFSDVLSSLRTMSMFMQ